MPEPVHGNVKACALFLDIDGTLLELAPKPDQVTVPAYLPDLLRALAGHLGGALALISGRELAEIDRLVPGNLDAAGSHGAEWRQAGRAERTGVLGPELDQLAGRAAGLEGLLVERKPSSVAVHYKDARQHEPALRHLAASAIRQAAPSLRLLEGKGVIEVVPAGADKGAAINRFMAQAPFAGRRPLFIGDDVTDEAGFGAVNAIGGISVHVGAKGAPTQALRRVRSPLAVRRWLVGLEKRLRGKQHG